jgi:hypothetical protein
VRLLDEERISKNRDIFVASLPRARLKGNHDATPSHLSPLVHTRTACRGEVPLKVHPF